MSVVALTIGRNNDKPDISGATMNNHRVEFVDDDALPDGVDWVLAEEGEFNALFVKRSAPLCDALSEAWVAFHTKTVRRPFRVPRPRLEELRTLVVTIGLLVAVLQPWVTTETIAGLGLY